MLQRKKLNMDLKRKKVLIIPSNERTTTRMFEKAGWEVVQTMKEADLVQFTGGADVDPMLYGEQVHRSTMYSTHRDTHDMAVYSAAFKMGKPMAGICRGGQFLNVMNEGTMFQDVDHHCETHDVLSVRTSQIISCTSTHHQMMIPSEDAEILGIVPESRTTYKTSLSVDDLDKKHHDRDYEVLKYGRQLCFQPHPEYLNIDSDCTKWYFELLEEITS
jgi:hypothetical protein